MTSQELLRHLRNVGDSIHTAISTYLETLNTFSQGHVRQDPGVNTFRGRGKGGGGGQG
jgi:hypothetical protein